MLIVIDFNPLRSFFCRDLLLAASGDSKEGTGWAMAHGPPRFLPVPPSFFLNFPFKFVWLTHTVDNFRPAIF